MADDVTTNETKEEDTPVNDPVAEKIEKDVKAKVAEAQAAGTIRNKVVEQFADQKVEERVDLLRSALEKRADKKKELDKIKADKVSFDAEGKEVASHWTQEQVKKRKKAQENLNKLDKAIGRAVEQADYEGLKKLAKNN